MKGRPSTPRSMPATIEKGDGEPEFSCARGSSASTRMLEPFQWASLTHTSSAPPANAPRTAAFTSSVMTLRKRWYSACPGVTWFQVVTPVMPSMSTESRIFMRSLHRPVALLYGELRGASRRREPIECRHLPAENFVPRLHGIMDQFTWRREMTDSLFPLSEEHRMIRDAARDFAKNAIAPIAAQFDESGEFPHETIKKMGELGWMGIEVP